MANRSTQALASVRDRVRRYISVPVSDSEALKICFTCSTVDSDALLELSHSRVVRTEACTHSHALSISSDEFASLLNEESLTNSRRYNLNTALVEDELDAERKKNLEDIVVALKLTLNEKSQRDLWESNPRVRMRVSLALLRKDNHVDCLRHALGEVLASDLRRVEDLRCCTDEEGIDIMSVSALISAVCTNLVT